MGKLPRHIKHFLTLAAVALGIMSCDKVLDRYDTECNYTVRIRYDYNRENTSDVNLLTTYISSLEEYIFDSDGVLYAINPLAADVCTGQWVSEHLLPPGHYSVIAVGNRTDMSKTYDQDAVTHSLSAAAPVIGRTRRENMMLALTRRSTDGSDDGKNYNNCGRLYYGYRTFTVTPTGISYVRVDMVHSHLDLMFTIRWKNNKVPVNTNDFYVTLTDLPSQYNLMPEFAYPRRNVYEVHDPASTTHDPYESVSQAVRHYIPYVMYEVAPVNYRENVRLRNNTISSQTISYRIRNCDPGRPVTNLSLWRGNGTPERLMNDVQLNDFFNRNGIDLDHTLRQQYHIMLEIDGDTGQVDVWLADIADWDEGGYLGG